MTRRQRETRQALNILLLMCAVFLISGCMATVGIVKPQVSTNADVTTEVTFQEYFWYENQMVLLLHVALMLAGAIGVVALLPAPYEEETNE